MESELTRRLALIVDWYKGMVSPEEGRLVYTYYPEEDFAVADGSPIRDIASVWDIEVLCRFLDRTDLLPIAERSLRHFTGWLVARNGGLILDSERLGEPSGIAHSAFLLLSLLESHLPDRQSTMFALADGILGQQRHDGSYKVHFGDEPDDGIEFYPGEAMLALMEAYTSTGTSQYLASVERGFAYCRDRFGSASASSGLLVFLANWQSQYAAVLHERTHDDTLREQVRDYVMLLHDRILHGGFYEEIERVPVQQATVEVACALEGINDAYTIAVRERDARHVQAYERAIRIAVAYLFRAQRLDDCTPRERGGFGHSLGDRTQRVDVTGHVVGGFIKTVRNHVTTERSAAPAGIGTMRGPL